jgi:hypothetical protein
MNAEINALIAQLPEGGRLAPDDARPAREALAKLFVMCPGAVPEIVALLKPAEEGGDARVRLAVHNLATLAAGADEKERAAFCQALAATLKDERPAEVKTFIIAQLQLCGGAEVTAALAELLSDEAQGEPAAHALLAIRTGAAEAYRKSLPSAKGRMQLVLVQNLGVLRDAEAMAIIRPLVGSDDQTLRLVAARTLGQIGNSLADANSLLALARREEGYAQAKAVDACFDLAERLGELKKGDEQRQLLTELQSLGKGNYVSEAAQRQLAAVGK